ncbi:hypothetical protein ACIQ6V_33280 [Streptomyces sp. NPDC096198]|uniref:hypothetical protein n=1 Tax=Streptomyces sp. NPDC096198 TaxID=3366080 RepID=UPI00382A76D4
MTDNTDVVGAVVGVAHPIFQIAKDWSMSKHTSGGVNEGKSFDLTPPELKVNVQGVRVPAPVSVTRELYGAWRTHSRTAPDRWKLCYPFVWRFNIVKYNASALAEYYRSESTRLMPTAPANARIHADLANQVEDLAKKWYISALNIDGVDEYPKYHSDGAGGGSWVTYKAGQSMGVESTGSFDVSARQSHNRVFTLVAFHWAESYKIGGHANTWDGSVALWVEEARNGTPQIVLKKGNSVGENKFHQRLMDTIVLSTSEI